MSIKVTTFESAEHLKTPAEFAAFLNDAFETGAPNEIVYALGIAARARGMSQIAKDTHLGRESLYKAFRPGSKPEFATAFKVMRSLGVMVIAKPLKKKKAAITSAKKQRATPKRVKVERVGGGARAA